MLRTLQKILTFHSASTHPDWNIGEAAHDHNFNMFQRSLLKINLSLPSENECTEFMKKTHKSLKYFLNSQKNL